MSSVKTWFTKEEVLKDLAKVSGRRVGKLDESYLVVGNAPPPVIPEAEDEEMLERFGDSIRDRGIQCENAPPDLQGITDLIRMVDESDAASDEDLNIANNSNCVIAISKGSRLNPNVKEFIPRSGSSHSSSEVSLNNTKTDIKETDDKNKISVACEAKVTPVCEDLATKLKNSVATKSDSFESKKQNNVAIASLLRLYAANNNKQAKTETITEPVKLVTPDFYESKSSPTKDLEDSPAESKSTSTTPVPKTDSSSSPSISSNDANHSEPKPSIQDTNTSPVNPKLDPAIKKSIEKVNQWMGEPVPKKAPAVCLGPISFKRREPNASKSPSSASDTDQRPTTKPNQPNEYRPSNYASDLVKKYMERKEKENARKVNSWTDLDVILKQKDEIILKKQMAQANGSTVSDAPQC